MTKIELPKKLREFSFPITMKFSPNFFDIDFLLPSLFYLAVSGGHERGKIPAEQDPKNHELSEFVEKLCNKIEGMDSRHLKTMGRFAESSLVQMGRLHSSGKKRQIMAIRPYSLLAFKPGFPADPTILCGAHVLLYQMFQAQLKDESKVHPCFEFFKQVFGKGVFINAGDLADGKYDGKTPLDTMTRVSLAFIDGFKPTTHSAVGKAKNLKARALESSLLPKLEQAIGRSLWRYLAVYHHRMTTEALTYHFSALMNLELFVYSLKNFYAVAELVETPSELPSAMTDKPEDSAPEIYADFTEGANLHSLEMARFCLRRDFDSLQRFIVANFTLRQLDKYFERQLRREMHERERDEFARLKEKDPPRYLQKLLHLRDDPYTYLAIKAIAGQEIDEIREYMETRPSATVEDVAASMDRITEGLDRFDGLIALLVEGQGAIPTDLLVKWLRALGGLTKRHGLLAGTPKQRQSWRYAPSNDLLATLVQLANVDIQKMNRAAAPRPVSLQAFLNYLECRFGILVNRPPSGFSGATYTAAAQENLRSMLRRLRQMGVFRDLSDDFTVQRLMAPYGDLKEMTTNESE